MSKMSKEATGIEEEVYALLEDARKNIDPRSRNDKKRTLLRLIENMTTSERARLDELLAHDIPHTIPRKADLNQLLAVSAGANVSNGETPEAMAVLATLFHTMTTWQQYCYEAIARKKMGGHHRTVEPSRYGFSPKDQSFVE